MSIIINGNTITLTGYVGEHWEYDGEVIIDGFTHPMVISALAEIGDDTDLTVHINSGGGFAIEGVAIHSVLAQRAGRTDVVIEGMAASAASLIAMVGETISMANGAQFMIHDPSGFTIGTVADHELAIRSLESLATSYARVYSRRSGITVKAAREIMKAETWYGDEEAVEAGFADLVLGNKGQPVAAFPYQQYAHAPQQLVALAKENGWRLPAARPAPPAASTAASSVAETRHKKEINMTDKTVRSPAHATATARIKAIMKDPEAEGRASLAEHLAFDTTMTAEAAVAVMKAAPAGGEDFDPVAQYEAHRTAQTRHSGDFHLGAGLGGDPRRVRAESSIVAAMKQRHGLK